MNQLEHIVILFTTYAGMSGGGRPPPPPIIMPGGVGLGARPGRLGIDGAGLFGAAERPAGGGGA